MTVAIGFFDGVHLGHQAILAGADMALTFENHPLSFLTPQRAPRLIMSREERTKAIRSLGVHVTALDFDAEIANLTPVDFLQRLKGYAAAWAEHLKIPAEPLQIRCGANWRFGKGGIGDAAFARAHGIATTVAPYAIYRDEPISSTRIRAALEAGAIEDANAMLGRPHRIYGEVFSGKGKGREIGYPTVNLRSPIDDCRDVRAGDCGSVRLPLGVYAVEVDGVIAIANYGLAPSFKSDSWKSPVWEIHFLEPQIARTTQAVQTLQSVRAFALRRFIRPERTFTSLAELRAQIARDCDVVRSLGESVG